MYQPRMYQPRFAGTVPGTFLLTALLVAAGTAVAADAGAVELRPIREVRMLSADAIAVPPTVRIRGVVTFRGNTELIVQDETGGLYAHFRGSSQAGMWQHGEGPPADVAVGDEVEIEGVVFNAVFSPGFWPRIVVNHGPKQLPETLEIDPERFFGGAHACEIIAFSGIVHRIRDADNYWQILLDSDARSFSAFIAKRDLAAALGRGADAITHAEIDELLVDAVVRVVGPCAMRMHSMAAWFAPQVNVSRAEWFHVVKPAPQPAFESPRVPIAMLGRQRPWEARGHRVCTSGVVIHAIPGEVVFLQDKNLTVRVESSSAGLFRPGDVVEAAGFVLRRGWLTGLADAVVRKTGDGPAPSPVEMRSPDQISSGQLLHVSGPLLEVRPTLEGGVLMLSTEWLPVDVHAHAEAFEAVRGLPPGAVLSVTGVAEMVTKIDEKQWPLNVPDRLRLIVREAEDVKVVVPAPWWTRGRLAAVLGLLAATLLGSLAWTSTLRRRLRLQTARLASEMRSRRDAAVEFAATLQERNRLAANLHDTLLQTLGGIGYQLDACEGNRTEDEDARLHFDVARRMVNHATGELHNAVWAMRSLPVRERSLPDALQAVVGRVGEGHTAAIEVRTHGPLGDVPEFVAGNLLLIVQEAVHNALRHGRPRNILVEVAELSGGRSIRATIADDGTGFAGADGSGPEDRGAEAGHFGLLGMRERAERLGGSFQIESEPGRGTTVTVEVRRSEFDREMAEPLAAAGR